MQRTNAASPKFDNGWGVTAVRGLSDAGVRRRDTRIGRGLTAHASAPARERTEASASADVRRRNPHAYIDELVGRRTSPGIGLIGAGIAIRSGEEMACR